MRHVPRKLASLLILFSLALRASAWSAEPASARFSDNGAILENPGMGWVFHHFDNSIKHYGSDLPATYAGKDFPGCSVVYLRLAWSYLEPEEGKFNWSAVDSVAQRWIARGKKVAFRFTCCETGITYATPEWVRNAGVDGVYFIFGKGAATAETPGARWAPDYENPIFLEKLERFLAAAAARYDGDPDVAFIDIGTYGLWGEGHVHMSGQTPSAAAIMKQVELYHKLFKKTLIVGHDDWVIPGKHAEFSKGGAVEADLFFTPPKDAAPGQEFELKAGIWIPGDKQLTLGRFQGRGSDLERRVPLGRFKIAGAEQIEFTPAFTHVSPGPGADFSIAITGEVSRHRLGWRIPVRYSLARPLAGDAQAFAHVTLNGRICGDTRVRIEQMPEALKRAQELGMTMRDDSILVQPGISAYFHENFAQAFWPTVPVILESEHYGPSRDRGRWADGSRYLAAMEDYHASYCSIHWFPQEFLKENRDLIHRMNLRMGYRIRLEEAAWPVRATALKAEQAPQPVRVIDFTALWRNAGVAPCYGGGFPALTLKDAQGGIAAVTVDEAFDVSKLPVGPPEQAQPVTQRAEMRLSPLLKPGEYDLFISVGNRSGKPVIALPLGSDDGQRRYKIGRIAIP